MRHTAVTRVVLGLAALLVTAVVWFALLAAPRTAETAAPDGEALFRGACAGCHAASELADGLRRAEDRLGALTELLELLDDHGPTSTAEDLLIAGYLAGRGGAADGD
jgi:hypothetical protein